MKLDRVFVAFLVACVPISLFLLSRPAVLTAVCLRVVVRGSLRGLGLGLVPTVLIGLSIQVTESAMFGMGQVYPYIFWLVVAAATINPQRRPQVVESGQQPQLVGLGSAH